ncbi:MAG: acyltransferase [Pelagerythrobacter marensis]|nr:MAG: acyltransferase [Pelagerythrobacter marensis]PZU15777.1 MAG: acyltransferase [Citromicrobium sp.]
MSRRPAFLSRAVHRILIALYDWRGYRFAGVPPGVTKCIITGAPHTSNWDFIFVLGGVRALGLKPAFMGKNTLFRWPMTRFMHDMGGIPVDRSRRGGRYVEQVAAAFAEADELALVIAPEGSRSGDGIWRSGFWHIAKAAGVPIVPAWVDQANRRGGIGEPIWPSDDYAADLAQIAAFYRAHRPDCPRFERLAAQSRRLAADLH